eukprot:Clim_evm7s139 gene=Clim_evmTU7s139
MVESIKERIARLQAAGGSPAAEGQKAEKKEVLKEESKPRESIAERLARLKKQGEASKLTTERPSSVPANSEKAKAVQERLARIRAEAEAKKKEEEARAKEEAERAAEAAAAADEDNSGEKRGDFERPNRPGGVKLHGDNGSSKDPTGERGDHTEPESAPAAFARSSRSSSAVGSTPDTPEPTSAGVMANRANVGKKIGIAGALEGILARGPMPMGAPPKPVRRKGGVIEAEVEAPTSPATASATDTPTEEKSEAFKEADQATARMAKGRPKMKRKAKATKVADTLGAPESDTQKAEGAGSKMDAFRQSVQPKVDDSTHDPGDMAKDRPKGPEKHHAATDSAAAVKQADEHEPGEGTDRVAKEEGDGSKFKTPTRPKRKTRSRGGTGESVAEGDVSALQIDGTKPTPVEIKPAAEREINQIRNKPPSSAIVYTSDTDTIGATTHVNKRISVADQPLLAADRTKHFRSSSVSPTRVSVSVMNRKGMSIMSSADQSHLQKVERQDRICLYAIKGKRRPRTLRVPLRPESMSHDDCYVLETKICVYIWNGAAASITEKGRAVDVAHRIRDSLYGGRIPVIKIDDQPHMADRGYAKKFWSILLLPAEEKLTGKFKGSTASLGTFDARRGPKSCRETSGDDQAFETLWKGSVKFIHVTEDSHNEVAVGIPSTSILDQHACTVVKGLNEIFIWSGRFASEDCKINAVALAEDLQKELLEDIRLGDGTFFNIGTQDSAELPPVNREVAGSEDVVFKELFSDFQGGMTLEVGQVGNIKRKDATPYTTGADKEKRNYNHIEEFGESIEQLDEPSQTLFTDRDNGTGDMKVWVVNEKGKLSEAAKHREHRILASTRAYIFVYEFAGKREMYVMYLWQGSKVPPPAKAALALRAKEINDSQYHAQQVMVVEGQEPPHFGRMLHEHCFLVTQDNDHTGDELTVIRACDRAFISGKTVPLTPTSAQALLAHDTSAIVRCGGKVFLCEGNADSEDARAEKALLPGLAKELYGKADKTMATKNCTEFAAVQKATKAVPQVSTRGGYREVTVWAVDYIGGYPKLIASRGCSYHRLSSWALCIIAVAVQGEKKDEKSTQLYLWVSSRVRKEELVAGLKSVEALQKHQCDMAVVGEVDPEWFPPNVVITTIEAIPWGTGDPCEISVQFEGHEGGSFRTDIYGVPDKGSEDVETSEFFAELPDRSPATVKVVLDRLKELAANVKIYPLADIKGKRGDQLPKDIDRTHPEDHISDEDFKVAFGMDREAFEKLPQWKKVVKKKEADVF